MSADWKTASLASLCVDVSYGYTESAQHAPVGPKFLRITDIQNGVVNWPSVPYCTIDTHKLPNYLLRRGDIVIARTGNSTGENYVFDSSETAVFASYLIRYRIDEAKVNPFYVWYQLRTQKWWDFVAGSKTGSAQAGANAQVLGKFEIAIPSRKVQDRIVDQFKAIDSKIATNRRINQTLEAMAQAIFKSWFVDFEPVKAKTTAIQEGRDPLRAAMSAISGKPDAELDALPPEQHEQLTATAALFPDEFEELELGGIPKGWKAKKFGDFIDRISVGKKFDQKAALVKGLVPILDQGKSGIIGFHNESPGVRASLEKPIVVFANHTCYMRLITFDFSAIQNVLPFVGKDVDTVWAYYATKGAVKFSEYKGHWPDFVLADAVVPQANLTVHFRKILQPLISQMRIIELESEKLAVLRDTLLPKLLSGELSVTAATAEAEA